MADQPEDEELRDERLPDRPLECSACKKPIAVRYTEIENDQTVETSMCAECPQLQRHLKGIPSPQTKEAEAAEVPAGVVCGDCGTTLESVQVGHALGCSHCYEVFSDAIISELTARSKIPAALTQKRRPHSLHIGRAPGEAVEINPSLRLIALNEALDETLKREDYEQAAMIRDQIKSLTESSETESQDDRKQ